MFLYNLEDIAKKLQIDYEGVSRNISHNGVKGTAREDILKSYIRSLLPTKYSITSGIIMDNHQTQSKQQDFIVYDSFSCPSFFKTETNTILPIESVYATIEIKSNLDYSTLQQSVKNIQSVRSLKKLSGYSMFENKYTSEYPLGFVFAYTSDVSLEKIQIKLAELNENIEPCHQLSIICILDKGLVFNVKKENMIEFEIIPSKDTLLGRSESGIDKSLYAFYLFILEYLNSVYIQVPSLIQYAINMDAFKIPLNIPSVLIPDDAVLKQGPFTANYGDTKRLFSINQKYPHLYDGKMTSEEAKEYILSKDFFTVMDIMFKISTTPGGNLNLFGITVSYQEYTNLRSAVEQYNTDTTAKVYVDSFINNYYKAYKAAANAMFQ